MHNLSRSIVLDEYQFTAAVAYMTFHPTTNESPINGAFYHTTIDYILRNTPANLIHEPLEALHLTAPYHTSHNIDLYIQWLINTYVNPPDLPDLVSDDSDDDDDNDDAQQPPTATAAPLHTDTSHQALTAPHDIPHDLPDLVADDTDDDMPVLTPPAATHRELTDDEKKARDRHALLHRIHAIPQRPARLAAAGHLHIPSPTPSHNHYRASTYYTSNITHNTARFHDHHPTRTFLTRPNTRHTHIREHHRGATSDQGTTTFDIRLATKAEHTSSDNEDASHNPSDEPRSYDYDFAEDESYTNPVYWSEEIQESLEDTRPACSTPPLDLSEAQIMEWAVSNQPWTTFRLSLPHIIQFAYAHRPPPDIHRVQPNRRYMWAHSSEAEDHLTPIERVVDFMRSRLHWSDYLDTIASHIRHAYMAMPPLPSDSEMHTNLPPVPKHPQPTATAPTTMARTDYKSDAGPSNTSTHQPRNPAPTETKRETTSLQLHTAPDFARADPKPRKHSTPHYQHRFPTKSTPNEPTPPPTPPRQHNDTSALKDPAQPHPDDVPPHHAIASSSNTASLGGYIAPNSADLGGYAQHGTHAQAHPRTAHASRHDSNRHIKGPQPSSSTSSAQPTTSNNLKKRRRSRNRRQPIQSSRPTSPESPPQRRTSFSHNITGAQSKTDTRPTLHPQQEPTYTRHAPPRPYITTPTPDDEDGSPWCDCCTAQLSDDDLTQPGLRDPDLPHVRYRLRQENDRTPSHSNQHQDYIRLFRANAEYHRIQRSERENYQARTGIHPHFHGTSTFTNNYDVTDLGYTIDRLQYERYQSRGGQRTIGPHTRDHRFNSPNIANMSPGQEYRHWFRNTISAKHYSLGEATDYYNQWLTDPYLGPHAAQHPPITRPASPPPQRNNPPTRHYRTTATNIRRPTNAAQVTPSLPDNHHATSDTDTASIHSDTPQQRVQRIVHDVLTSPDDPNAVLDSGAMITTAPKRLLHYSQDWIDSIRAAPPGTQIRYGNMDLEPVEETASIGSYHISIVPDSYRTALICVHDIVLAGHTVMFTNHDTIVSDVGGAYTLRIPRSSATREWRAPLHLLQRLTDLRDAHPLHHPQPQPPHSNPN